MRVLVTGGARFIRSHLVERLLTRGDGVVVLDSLEARADARLNAAFQEAKLEGH